jgi:hypothetical protein
MLLEMAGDQRKDGASVVGVEITERDQMIGERPPFFECPGLKCGDQFHLVDQTILERKESEQQVAARVEFGHETWSQDS